VRDDRYLLHDPGLRRPERPERLVAVYEAVDRDFKGAVVTFKPKLASLEDLALVHTPAYITKVLRTAERAFTHLAPDTPVGSQSYLAASLAAGGSITGLDAMLAGECDVCFALVRPPGHHALPDTAGGFCIFNNPAITARYALSRHALRRILIVDWDAHHGNGIQDVFYAEKEALYFSSHFMGWYPRTGDWEETGSGDGAGYTINLPLPIDIGDNDLAGLYRAILSPVAASFKPELIVVAAGFDGHYLDPVGRLKLTEKCFGELTRTLLDLRDACEEAPVLLVLEGGYDVNALALCVREVLRVLVTGDAGSQQALSLSDTGMKLLEKARGIHRKFGVWEGRREPAVQE